MKKLELKHIAPYLPYGLRVSLHSEQYFVRGLNVNTVGGFDYFIQHDFKERVGNEFWSGDATENVKPLLKPLSTLTQGSKDYREFSGEACLAICEESHIDLGVENWSYQDVEKLFELHYDAFGLIDSGLAETKQ
jgi:hypothetical protein